MLDVKEIVVGYNATAVVRGVNLTLRPGQIVALIGANGAGKSTIVKALSGILPLQSGRILLDGDRLDKLSPRQRVLRGVVHIPEGRQVFAGLSVLDNLRMGCFARPQARTPQWVMQRVQAVCERLPHLLDRLDEPAGNLSGGQQQMLAIARGLMSEPRILMLDEPSLGLAPMLVSEVFRLVDVLRKRGISILLSEQNARMSLRIADYAYVIEKGRIALEGTGQHLLNDPNIVMRYLGMDSDMERPEGVGQDLTQRLREFFSDLRAS